MIVFAPQLLNAAADMRERDSKLARLKDPIKASAAQLQKAGEILRDGPQPVANGIQGNMPGFFRAEDQADDDTVLTLHVGILGSTGPFRIDRDGNVIEGVTV